jgi:hypothetical protein
VITPEQIRQLALLYDRFTGALDPFDPGRDQAEHDFYRLLEQLHYARAADTKFADFRREAVRQCVLYLHKN